MCSVYFGFAAGDEDLPVVSVEFYHLNHNHADRSVCGILPVLSVRISGVCVTRLWFGNSRQMCVRGRDCRTLHEE